MYLSLNWLKDYVSLPGGIKPGELGEKLTMHTVEIDGVEDQAQKYDQTVVGEILEVKPHPNADRLQLALVNVGNLSDKPLNIVCGAPNIEAGQKVPVALPGAVLPNGLKIARTKVRGEASEGMLCAEDELGLGEDHSGILILEKSAKPGRSFAEYKGLKDVVFEVDNKSITNRPDLWGHIGYARELAAFLDSKKTKKFNDITSATAAKIKVDSRTMDLSVKVEDPEDCPRYMAIALSGIKVGESPEWLKERLVAVGVRPVNNVVDITNYVMLEIGQPMHAFDASWLADDAGRCGIRVRRAKNQEKIVTLDSVERDLVPEDIVISCQDKAIGLAGVMGGENSEISEKTKDIVLEAANFNSISIRKTAKRLNLRTDAAIRFEKSLDPGFCEIALVRAVSLIREICPEAKVISDPFDISTPVSGPKTIVFDSGWLSGFLGIGVSSGKIENIFNHLGFSFTKEEDTYSVAVPSWRATKDISQKEDLAEEIARIFGYNSIEPVRPAISLSDAVSTQERKIVAKTKDILSGSGALNEVLNYSFVGEANLKKLGVDFSSHIRLINPLSKEHGLLRQSLAPNMFLNVIANQAKFDSFGLFEIGSVFLPIGGEDFVDDKKTQTLPFQEKRLSILLCGAQGRSTLVASLKSEIQNLLAGFYRTVGFIPTENIPAWADPDFSAEINVSGNSIGWITAVSAGAARRFGIKKDLVIAEMPVAKLMAVALSRPKYKESGKFPPVIRDLAFVVSASVSYKDLFEAISGFHPYVGQVELFDVYSGDKLGAKKKSLAFHIAYQADKTLTSQEVDVLQDGLFKALEEKFEAKVRDF